MTRYLLLAACVLSLVEATSANAQFAVGAQVGVNLTSLSGDAPSNTSYKSGTGFAAGIVGEIPLAENVKLSLQPMYLQRPFTLAVKLPEEEEERDSVDFRLDYVTMPILLKVVTGSGKTYVSGGVNLGYLVDATATTSTGSSDVSRLFHEIDLSADFAFGVQLPIGSPLLTLELRYEQAILNIANSEENPDEESLPVRFRTSGFQFYAGVLLPLGRE
jgi:hypothetical protein